MSHLKTAISSTSSWFQRIFSRRNEIRQNERVFIGNMYNLQNLTNFDKYSAIQTNLHINTRVFDENTYFRRYLRISRVSGERNEISNKSQVSTLRTVVSSISSWFQRIFSRRNENTPNWTGIHWKHVYPSKSNFDKYSAIGTNLYKNTRVFVENT